MHENHKLWVEKYRPQSIDEYIFHDANQKASFIKMMREKTIPHLLLSGVQGSGKTTIAQILMKSMELDETDILVINASLNNSVDTMRDQIYNFVTSFAMGPFKIVCLEEADFISPHGQAVMRRLMEEYSENARFILTCNYEHKILPAIKSRCQHFHFKAPDKAEVAAYCMDILVAERIEFQDAALVKYIAYGYPDIRKIVNALQQNADTLAKPKVLNAPRIEGNADDWKFALIDLIERDRWVDIRQLVCSTVDGDEWTDVYRFLYENLKRAPKFKDSNSWEEGILTIAKHLYQHALVADPEINAAAMFIGLMRI